MHPTHFKLLKVKEKWKRYTPKVGCSHCDIKCSSGFRNIFMYYNIDTPLADLKIV